MRPPLRFQVLCLPNVPWQDLRQRVVRLERLGVEVAALPDHFVDWTHPPSPWFESWTALSGLAGSTTSIRLTTCVTQIPFRNPAMFARQALTLDHISNGRVEVGLGTGLAKDPSLAMVGVPDWDGGERVARLAEYVQIVDRLLRDEVTSFAGEYYRVEGAIMNPRPVQSPRPPITVGALGPVMIRHAARLADTWNSLSFRESFEEQVAETRERVALMDAAREALGRDRDSVRYSYTMFDARARPRGGAMDYYESVDRFEEMVGRILELAMDEIVLYHPLDDRQMPTFERIATDVLPRLRDGIGPATAIAHHGD
ncbi:MAG TPA: LLM class flavin-dependent oxidoreductase [Candidatus Limnocylindrales bacterium]|nr:LLM class flavin-dependent oxidoreductase [Candidatus Limnocylindrales bacterium]